MAEECAKRGFNVIICARRLEKLQEVSAGIRKKYGVSTKEFTVDISEEDASNTIIENIRSLDIGMLIYNAAIEHVGYFIKVDEAYHEKQVVGNTEMLSMEGRLYVAERSAICSLAHYGRAVFVGHCASEALKEQGNVLHVFIRAAEGFRNRRAVSDYGIDEKDVESVCRRFDKKRAKYYAFNTSRKWDDMSNYDMVLDSSRLGIDGCVRAIAALLG